MTDGAAKGRWVVWALVGVVLAGAGYTAWLNLRETAAPPPEGPAPGPTAADPFAPPPYSETRFLNTGDDARHIGSAACAACHRGNHQSYLHTAHSKALADLDPAAEPPDGSFVHKPSGRSYRVYRQDGQLRHEEVVRTSDGQEIARLDHPVRYLIGSGHFCRSYLIETDGFLHESPITWYTSRKAWDVSPGYDFPAHWGFERPAKLGCLACHSGRVEAVPGTVHRLTIHEKAIGCESCHGPGSKHSERHRREKRPAGEDDPTIVNPGKLPRPLLESTCSACHLNGAATVYHRGRQDADFRPGRPLTDYRSDYRFDSGSEKMTVVGHMEQLRNSACYQKSELTCLTCHDPHAREKPKDLVAFYRQKCLDCHADRGCQLPPAERLKKEPADNCSACHMPRGDTDIPHIAFTHHRIGKHPAPLRPESGRVPDLVPTDDAVHLSPIDRRRNLGLAYLEVSQNTEYARFADEYRERARTLLEGVLKDGLPDGAAAEALAEIYAGADTARTRRYARQALDAPDLKPEARAYALILLASSHLDDQNAPAAIPLLEDLVRIRRYHEDWRLLGMSYLAAGKREPALAALRQALAIRPYKADVHASLAEYYRATGDPARAREHLERADWLAKNRQQ
jgi:predicted CXXCH cytochrome family protein